MSASLEIALRDLIARGLVTASNTIEAVGRLGGRSFDCQLPIPHPNAEGLPSSTPARIVLPDQFPLSKVDIILTDLAMRGFAHQDLQTGSLCLKDDDHYPSEATARLLAYVEGAIGWLEHAAAGTLLAPGEYWELPDFRTGRPDRGPSVVSLEDESTLSAWLDRQGQSGVVQFTGHVHGCGLVPTRFTHGGETVLEPTVSEGFLDRKRSAMGTWVLLPSLVYTRHRPALTFSELEEQCCAHGVNLWSVLQRSTKMTPHGGYHYLLVGAPIPERVDGSLKLVHWQPVALTERELGRIFTRDVRHRPKKTPKATRRTWLQTTLAPQPIPWGTSTTYPENRSEARGSLAPSVKQSRVCALGCGALGGPLAEHLARGGTRELALFDKDTVELENLSRHPLSPLEVGGGKAIKLAQRLNGIHPGAHVRGFAMQLPPVSAPAKSERVPWDLLQRAEVLLDCTTNRSVFYWASQLGRQTGKLVVHAFLNAHARMLTLCFSGRHISCRKVLDKLLADIDDGKTSFSRGEYDPDEDVVQPGAGCWQSTFPARGSDIGALLSAAVPLIERAIHRRESHGTAIILRRNELKPSGSLVDAIPASLVEVVWVKNYR
jgi:ThiF family